MASELSVQTASVSSAAAGLSRINRQMDEAFSSVTAAVSAMQGSWSGPAASAAEKMFFALSRTNGGVRGRRKEVMDDCARFLQTQVEENYESTEYNNKNLAELFR